MPIVDQQPHQLRHGDGRVGVVELNRPVVGEVLDGQSAVVEAAQHVLQRAADEEVLLLQAQTSAFVGAVVGVQHLGEGFAAHLFLNGAVVVADVEGIEVEAFGGIGTPEPQPVADVDAIAQHRHVMGNADGVFRRDPAGAVVAFVVDVALGATAEAHEAGLIGLGQFPGPAALEPFVGDLHLPAIADQLIEDAELVADAIAGGRDLQAGQRFHVAGRQTAKPAVAQAGFLLHIQDLLQRLDAEILQGLLGFLLDPEVQQVAVELRADQEFRRQVGHRFLRAGPHRFSGGQVAHHQPITHRIAQGHVEVMAAGGGGELAEREEQVFRHAVEHALGIEAGAFWVVVTAGGRQTQIERL